MYPTSYSVASITIEPNLVLSPMEGVTDLTFRRLIRQIGGAGLTVTEFVPGAALMRGDPKFIEMVSFDADERPVAVQLYGKDPIEMAEGARLVAGLGADIVDINMGCPSKKVCKNSGGSALMREPEVARAIVEAVVEAVDIPVTVKMRSGFDADTRNAPELAWICQESGAQAVAIHWRTREDKYSGDRAVDKIAETKARLSIPVLANGDIVDVESARRMFEDTGCDGLLVGRGAIRDPWLMLRIQRWQQGLPDLVVDDAAKHRCMLAYVEGLQARFTLPTNSPERVERLVLGRFKMLTRYFATRHLDDGSNIRTRVLRSETLGEALDHVDRHFEAR